MEKNKSYCVCATHNDGSPRHIYTTDSLTDALEYMMAMEDPEYTYDSEEDAECDDVLFSVHAGSPYGMCVAWINTDGKCGSDLPVNDFRQHLVKGYLLNDYCVCVARSDGSDSPGIIYRTNSLADAIQYMAAMNGNAKDAENDAIFYSTHIETPYDMCVAWISPDGKYGTDLSVNDRRWKLAKEYLQTKESEVA